MLSCLFNLKEMLKSLISIYYKSLMSVISDTFNKEVQSQSHGTNGSLIIKKEGEHSKFSDCSKDYKELTNEINKFLNGAEEVVNSKSNSGLGDSNIVDDIINGIYHLKESQSNHIENRISEMKKLNDIRLKTKKKQVKMIANTNKVSNELMEKCIIKRNEGGQTKKDKDMKNQNSSSVNRPKENLTENLNSRAYSNQLSKGIVNQGNLVEEDRKEKWISFPPKKMLYSTYSSSLPSMNMPENYYYPQETVYPNYYQQPQTIYYHDNTQYLNSLNTSERVYYPPNYYSTGQIPNQTYYSNIQTIQPVPNQLTQNHNPDNSSSKSSSGFTNSYAASQAQAPVSSNNDFSIIIENVSKSNYLICLGLSNERQQNHCYD